MNRVYFSVKKLAFYPHELLDDYINNNSLPEDIIEVPYTYFQQYGLSSPPINHVLASENGLPCWKELINPSNGDNPETERFWRNLMLKNADIEIAKIEDQDPSFVGSISQWRDYRKALRAWPEHEKFPNKDFRPIRPS